jgi:hypothetical protein
MTGGSLADEPVGRGASACLSSFVSFLCASPSDWLLHAVRSRSAVPWADERRKPGANCCARPAPAPAPCGDPLRITNIRSRACTFKLMEWLLGLLGLYNVRLVTSYGSLNPLLPTRHYGVS